MGGQRWLTDGSEQVLDSAQCRRTVGWKPYCMRSRDRPTAIIPIRHGAEEWRAPWHDGEGRERSEWRRHAIRGRALAQRMAIRTGQMPSDDTLIQIVDAALAEATRWSGQWLLCRPGCAQCCLGEFPITQLDAARLRRGLVELETRAPERAARVRQRVREAVARRTPMADDDPCAALDPETGTCDLYAARPITCRTFGPPVRCESGDLGVCELCFEGASDAEIAACEVDFDPHGLEPVLLRELEESCGVRGETSVALALSEMP